MEYRYASFIQRASEGLSSSSSFGIHWITVNATCVSYDFCDSYCEIQITAQKTNVSFTAPSLTIVIILIILCLTMTLFRIGGISDHSGNPVHVDVEGDNMMVNKIILEPIILILMLL